LAIGPGSETGSRMRLRARGSILAMSESLTQHGDYFDASAPR
jgi:hypothetical protein